LDLNFLKRALFVDARHACDYNVGHIEGAVNLPLHEFDKAHANLAAVPKDRMLVLYCDGVECNSSVELAKALHESGYVNVRIFYGGGNEWLAHKQPTEP
jgi:rhodanese-related sulfurtransferase